MQSVNAGFFYSEAKSSGSYTICKHSDFPCENSSEFLSFFCPNLWKHVICTGLPCPLGSCQVAFFPNSLGFDEAAEFLFFLVSVFGIVRNKTTSLGNRKLFLFYARLYHSNERLWKSDLNGGQTNFYKLLASAVYSCICSIDQWF